MIKNSFSLENGIALLRTAVSVTYSTNLLGTTGGEAAVSVAGKFNRYSRWMTTGINLTWMKSKTTNAELLISGFTNTL